MVLHLDGGVSFKTNEQLKEHIKYLHSDYEDSRRDSKTDTDANESEGEETYYEKDTTVTQSVTVHQPF